MATTVTGKLNKAAREFQAGAYTGFGVNVGKQYYDRETKQKEWTNYEAAFFSNNEQQINFMRSALVEGSVIEITAKEEKIKSFDGTNGPVLSIQLLDCALGYVFSGQQQQPQQNQGYQQPQQMAPQQQQQQYQQPAAPQQQAPQQFNDSVPF